MTRDLEGRVFLVTGATEGIGKMACRAFAERGATLAITARNRDKGERLVSEWKATTGNDRIEIYLGDLSKQEDVRTVARAFRAKHERLDVLCNNAGAIFVRYAESVDGFEMTFALNHLSYFLLTHELLPLLKQTDGARVVSTSSAAHRRGTLDLDAIAHRPSRTVGYPVYGDSKLANILFTRELARRLAGSGVVANCFHPGFVARSSACSVTATPITTISASSRSSRSFSRFTDFVASARSTRGSERSRDTSSSSICAAGKPRRAFSACSSAKTCCRLRCIELRANLSSAA
jgi:NAD(P)-dependent dehydrogenase (short-subunit alcohol dehydrogenase family)